MIEKEVEYSKEIDSNSSFSVFQSAWMSGDVWRDTNASCWSWGCHSVKLRAVLETHPLRLLPGR